MGRARIGRPHRRAHAAGNYSTSDDSVTISGDSRDTTYSYCVSGNKLSVTPQSTTPTVAGRLLSRAAAPAPGAPWAAAWVATEARSGVEARPAAAPEAARARAAAAQVRDYLERDRQGAPSSSVLWKDARPPTANCRRRFGKLDAQSPDEGAEAGELRCGRRKAAYQPKPAPPTRRRRLATVGGGSGGAGSTRCPRAPSPHPAGA